MVLLTPEGLGEAMLRVTEQVIRGKLHHWCCVGCDETDDFEAKIVEIRETISAVDNGDGVLVLAEMFGNSPSNLASNFMDEFKIEIIAVVNVPVLVKVAGLQETVPLKECTALAREAGRKYIKIASQELSGETTSARPQRPPHETVHDMLLIAVSFAQQAEKSLKKLRSERPNSDIARTKLDQDVHFMELLHEGLCRLIVGLEDVIETDRAPEAIEKANKEVDTIATLVRKWWAENKAEAVDWRIRFPVMGGAIGLLNLAGASPTLATGVAFAAIGNKKWVTKVFSEEDDSK